MEPTYNKAQKIAGTIVGFIFVAVACFAVLDAIKATTAPTVGQSAVDCVEIQHAQDWETALANNCPFTDKNGDYLYTWIPE